jgi:hypothetical protein
VTVAVAAWRSLEANLDLLAAYQRHVGGLPINDGCRSARRRGAQLFLARHPDLQAWMARTTPARLADLHRADAWPFVVWCFVAGHLRPDAELLLAKPGGVELASVWEAAHPGDAARVAPGRPAAGLERQLDPPGLPAHPAGGVPGGRQDPRRADRG